MHLIAAELVDLDLTASEINALANLADGQRPHRLPARRRRRRPPDDADQRARPARTSRPHHPRHARAGDRRSVLIELTDSGREAAAVISQTLTELERRALDGLPADAVAGFHAVLDALTKEGS